MRGPGEPVWSGSFAVEGAGAVRGDGGRRRRAARRVLTATARAFRHPRSPLERANDRLLLLLVAFAVPLAVGFTITAFTRVDSASARVQLLTAGIVNLVPEGLILLISLTAAVSAFKVAQRGVLAQQLNAVESLASVDVVCTDKTGTLTEPTLRVVGLVPAGGRRRARAGARAGELCGAALRPATRRCRRSRTPGSPTSTRAPRRWHRCRSRRGGAGARSTWATSASCWGRRSGSPPPTRCSPSGRASEASAGRRVLALGRTRGAAAGERLRAAVS